MQWLKRSTKALLIPASILSMYATPQATAQSCGASGLAVQILGSGGPEMQDKRASTSYLIWDHGKARVILDAGGGSALRFGESGAKMSQVDVFLFSHFHVDHSGDFPALIFSSWFEDRTYSSLITPYRRTLPDWNGVSTCRLPSSAPSPQTPTSSNSYSRIECFERWEKRVRPNPKSNVDMQARSHSPTTSIVFP